MCSIVSLLLPSFVLWVMMVSWLHFFRLGARLGSSTSFRQWIQKLRPQRDSNPQSSDSKSDALSVRLCGLLRFFPFVFFALSDLGEEESGTQCLLSSQCVNLFLCSKLISFELQSSLFSWIRSNWCGWIFFICELRLGSSTKKLKFTTTEGFEPPIFRFGSRHPFRWALRTFPVLFR